MTGYRVSMVAIICSIIICLMFVFTMHAVQKNRIEIVKQFQALQKNQNDWSLYINKHLTRQDLKSDLIFKLIEDETKDLHDNILDWFVETEKNLGIITSNQISQDKSENENMKLIRSWFETVQHNILISR